MPKEPIIRCKCCKGEAYGYLAAAMVAGRCPYCAANCSKGRHVPGPGENGYKAKRTYARAAIVSHIGY